MEDRGRSEGPNRRTLRGWAEQTLSLSKGAAGVGSSPSPALTYYRALEESRLQPGAPIRKVEGGRNGDSKSFSRLRILNTRSAPAPADLLLTLVTEGPSVWGPLPKPKATLDRRRALREARVAYGFCLLSPQMSKSNTPHSSCPCRDTGFQGS